MGSSAYLLQIRDTMKDTRKWILSSVCLPKDREKIYFFSNSMGLFLGQYFYKEDIPSGCVSCHIFTNNAVTLGEKDIQYWMSYDHAFRDVIPLPPNYNLIDINSSQSMISSDLDIYLSDRYSQLYNYQEIDLPLNQQQFTFTYQLTKGIKQYE